MAKILFVVLIAVAIVAVLAAAEFEDAETHADMEFMKRDPEMQEYFMAEKRGKNMRKYKYCNMYDQDCWCSRRSGKIVFCNGAGNGGDIGAGI